ncbi:MAG: type II toxin-antitoxin system RelB/DinJ family antitoxin [Boseongicola sp. SB0673_bin_14]|nr:type II toxin-antitoxin system RelB/DinJ family antitoxin [Boseongicola sp. SB0673_bin_14]
MKHDAVVRARIDRATKQRATAALAATGLSVSDAILLLMRRIAEGRRLPFDVKVPNAATIEAMEELAAGKGQRFETTGDLLADLGVQGRAGSRCPAARVRPGRRQA